jgi:hypothetical protein
MMKRPLHVVLPLLLLTLLFSTAAAHADSVTLTLSNPTQYIFGAGTLSYSGTISAPTTNTGTEYLNGDAYSLTGTGVSFNDSPFFNNAPLFLAPGQSYTGLLFTVGVAAGAGISNDTGFFSILGGANSGTYNTLVTDPFGAVVTPEPGSWVLLCTGMVGLAALFWQRRTSVSRYM